MIDNEKITAERRFVDFHSHILPGVDDGSQSIEESIAMLKKARECGTEIIVATPHFYPHTCSPERFLEKRSAAVEKLAQAVAQQRAGGADLPKCAVGAEVAYFRGISRSSSLSSLCVKGTRLVLIEMPHQRWDDYVLDDIYEINSNTGLIPIIAHIERYMHFQKKSVIEELMSGDILIQANADAFVFGKTRKKALKMLMADGIDFIGSDCHNMSDRSPDLGAAADIIEKNRGEAALTELLNFGDFALQNAEMIF